MRGTPERPRALLATFSRLSACGAIPHGALMRPPIAFDSVSPQSPLVAEGAAWLAGQVRDGVGDEDAVVAAGRALCDAQPAMAAFVALATRAILVARKAATEEAP